MFSTIGLFHKFSYFCTNKALFAVGKFKDIWDTGKDGRNAEKRSYLELFERAYSFPGRTAPVTP